MGTEKNCLWGAGGVWIGKVFFVDCLDYATEGVGDSVVDLPHRLAVGGGDNYRDVGCREPGEEAVEQFGGSGGGVIKAGSLRIIYLYLSLRLLLIVEAGSNSRHTTPRAHSPLEAPRSRVF